MTDELRTCRKCLRTLPVSAFYNDLPSRWTGMMTHVYTCRECAAFRRAVQRMHPAPVTGERRQCRKCGNEKSLSEFHKNNRGTREWRCKSCKQAYLTNRRREIAATDPERAAKERALHTKRERARRIRRVLRAARGGQS